MNTTVLNNDSQTVNSDRTITVSGIQNETVVKALTETYQANQKTTVTNQIEIASQTAFIHHTAATEIKLEVGLSSLLLRTDGYIELRGVTIVIDGSNSVTTHGNAVRSVADNEHIINGSTVVCDGSATTTVKGGMVMFNPVG
jgi:type VI secretion system secreted protein VgrG